MRQGERALAKALRKALADIGRSVARKLAHLGKAAEEEDEDETAAAVSVAVGAADWGPVAKAAEDTLTTVAEDGARGALVKLGVSGDESITSQTFTSARNWAKARSAELVGKQWVGGKLVDNPDADMAITDATRDDLRDAVAQAIEDGDSAAELGERIEGLGAFSEERALVIARTEIIRAHAQGQLTAMRESGVVEQKAWSTSEDGDTCDDCQGNADEGPVDLEDDFPSGDDAPPQHPACRCVLIAHFAEDAETPEESEDDESEESDAEDDVAE